MFKSLLVIVILVLSFSVFSKPVSEDDWIHLNSVERYDMLKTMVLNGNDDDALSTAILMISSGEKYARIYNIVGDIYIQKRNPEIATAYLEEAIKNDATLAFPYLNLAMASHMIATKNNSYDYYIKALNNYSTFFKQYLPESNDTDAQARLFYANINTGYAAASINRLDVAIYYFNSALRIYPNDAIATTALAYAYALLGNINQSFFVVNNLVTNINGYYIYGQPVTYYNYYPNYYNSILNFRNYLGYSIYGAHWQGPVIVHYDYNQLTPWVNNYYYNNFNNGYPSNIYRVY